MKTLSLTLPAAVVLAATVLAPDLGSQEARPVQSTDIEGLWNDLSGQDASRRTRALHAMNAQRTKAIYYLYWTVLNHARDPEKKEGVKAAMRMLGRFRAKEAVPVLVENITFTDTGRGAVSLDEFAAAPQIGALIEIGLPSLDPLARKVAETDDAVVRERAAFVIDEVLGTDLGVLYARDRRDRENDPTKRRRLAALVDQIDKVERNRKPKSGLGALRPPPVVDLQSLGPAQKPKEKKP